MNLDEDIKFAVLFRLINTDVEIPVFFPVKPMIGRLSEDNNVFTDILTGKKTISVSEVAGVNEEECFGVLTDVKVLLASTNESTIESAIRKLWSSIDGKAFICGSLNEDLSEPMMFPIEDSEYKRIFGYSLKEETVDIETCNKLIDDYLSGNISEYEYRYFLENLEFPSKSKCKIITINFNKQ